MPPLRTLVAPLLVASWIGAGVLAACSSSSNGPNGDGGRDAGVIEDAAADALDAALGPVFCGLPMPSTCPMTAPCTHAGSSCSACDGYFVVSDGAWLYYYSAVGGALAGEVAIGDAGIVACPYGFIPPTSCGPEPSGDCSGGDAGEDAGGDADDAGGGVDGAGVDAAPAVEGGADDGAVDGD